MKEFVRQFVAWWKGNSAVVYFVSFVFIYLISDRLVWMDDVFALNLNGWIGILHAIIPLFCLMLTPLFVFGRYAKCFYLLFLIVETVLLAIGWFVRINFKMILDGDWVGIVLGSSSDEIIWFARHYVSISMVLFVILLVAFIIGVVKLSTMACNSQVTKTTMAMGFAGILVFFYGNRVMDVCVEGKLDRMGKQVFGINLLIDTFRSWNNFKLLASMKVNPKIPNTIRMDDDISDDVVGVVVLGESATRSHWSLYGYEKATTPCMELRKKELTVFDDLVTPVGSTTEAMRYAFTTRTVERQSDLRFTMAQCLKRVGYDVAMFSNQDRWGEWDSDESFDFAGCDPFLFMKEQGETNRYDEVLLSYCTNYLAKVLKKTVVFLHLQGSHAPVSERYPKKDAPFKPELFLHSSDAGKPELTKNHYDNSIWYTDRLLERIIVELELLRKPTWLVYFSDHGETPSAKSWRTQTDNDLWEIPFVVWTSKEFKEKFPAKIAALHNAATRPLQSDQLFYGLLGFCGVKGLGNESSEDFLDPSFKCRKKRRVQNGRVEYVAQDTKR